MNPFFVGSWKERLLAELKSWIGTPYRHLGHYKGRGADCTLFIATAMLNIGIIGKLTYEHYHADWYVHAKDDFIATSYRENEKNFLVDATIVNVDPSSMVFGDVPLISFVPSKVAHHCGVFLEDGNFIHCAPHRGVIIGRWHRWWSDKAVGALRLVRK